MSVFLRLGAVLVVDLECTPLLEEATFCRLVDACVQLDEDFGLVIAESVQSISALDAAATASDTYIKMLRYCIFGSCYRKKFS